MFEYLRKKLGISDLQSQVDSTNLLLQSIAKEFDIEVIIHQGRAFLVNRKVSASTVKVGAKPTTNKKEG